MSEAAGSLPQRSGRRRLVPSATFGRFVARRALALVLLAIGITLVVFLLTQLVPSDPVTANLGQLGDMLLIARLDLLQFALDFGEPLGGLFGLRNALGELSGLPLPPLRFFASFVHGAFQFGGSPLGSVDASGERTGLTC